MPRFVILHHRLPPGSDRSDHYDLMFEDGEALLTWAIADLPSEQPQTAEELPPHRREYLTYEGPVSNNRGQVVRVAAGSFAWLQRQDGQLIAAIQASALTGELHLERLEGTTWRLSMALPGDSV